MARLNSRVLKRRRRRRVRTKNLIVILAVVGFALGLLLPIQYIANREGPFGFVSSFSGIFRSNAAESRIVATQPNKIVGEIADSLYQKGEKEYYESINFSIPEDFKGKTISDVNLEGEKKVVALTFDDGPWEGTTNDILYLLDKYGIKATFFVVGSYIQTYPEIFKKVVEAGHAIGNHTWNHRYHYHSEAASSREIDGTADLIKKLTGAKTALFRPPGGYLNNGLVSYAHKTGHVNIMWSADSLDYRASTQTIIRNILNQAGSGGILLMHDGGGNRKNTVAALPTIIETLRDRGYSFVTLPELLEMGDKYSKQTAQQSKEIPVQQTE